jgi:hypothetical protein
MVCLFSMVPLEVSPEAPRAQGHLGAAAEPMLVSQPEAAEPLLVSQPLPAQGLSLRWHGGGWWSVTLGVQRSK